jgi:hypothetical protein
MAARPSRAGATSSASSEPEPSRSRLLNSACDPDPRRPRYLGPRTIFIATHESKYFSALEKSFPRAPIAKGGAAR